MPWPSVDDKEAQAILDEAKAMGDPRIDRLIAMYAAPNDPVHFVLFVKHRLRYVVMKRRERLVDAS